MANTVETDVLIVGAGPAGAVASVLLSDYGIRNIMINKYASTSNGPRSHITNQRTMEILRDLNLETAAKQLATPQEYMGEHTYATSLAGEEFGRIRTWSTHPHAKAEHDLASPCSVCDIPQLYFEPLLVSEAGLRGSDVRFMTEYVSLEQDEQGVTATLFDRLNKVEYKVRAKYLIGADGARSSVAKDINLPYEGQMALGDSGSINIEFEADLTDLVDHRRSDMYWMLQAGVGLDGNGIGVLRMVRPWHKWVCVWGYSLEDGVPDVDIAGATEIVRKIIGSDRYNINIENISSWTINQQYAARNTNGRVFCMGDAVHRHTPMGGLGLNTSVQDAYNLCWKLALVLENKASKSLLDSYDAERTPIAAQIVDRAYRSLFTLPALFEALELPKSPVEEDMIKGMARLKATSAEGATRRAAMRRAMDATLIGFGGGYGVEMNQRYQSDAVYSDQAPEETFVRDKELYYQASTRPGAHLPHVWLTEEQRKLSIFDICGKGQFTLLTGLSGSVWREVASEVSARFGVEIKVHVIGPGQQYVDTYGDYAEICGFDESGALLVRPDMFIAWRVHDASTASTEQLQDVMKKILNI